MKDWAQDAVFYHIYPLGLSGAEARNDFRNPPVPRLRSLRSWADYLADLGITALYLGPVFESSAHGYDTKDYFTVDRRLGTNEDLREAVGYFHEKGIRVVLDGVFNHVGRDFPAFRDVLSRGSASDRAAWFSGLRFDGTSPYGDPFRYEGWNGCHDLVKLNTENSEVRSHLFDAVRFWTETFGIDGLRLDAADCLGPSFITELAAFCKGLKEDFWLLGEAVFGDYTKLAGPGKLDAVTNYEAYKGFWSSLNDRNYFEIAYSLARQSGPEGLYRGLGLYTFVDNHDVDRAASILTNKARLYPLYFLLFTAPGIPSVYYGSEAGIPGRKGHGTDAPLRPHLSPAVVRSGRWEADLLPAVKRLIALRRSCAALRRGTYEQLFTASEQLVFSRCCEEESLVVALNSADCGVKVSFRSEGLAGALLRDVENGETFRSEGDEIALPLHPNWGRVFVVCRERQVRRSF